MSKFNIVAGNVIKTLADPKLSIFKQLLKLSQTLQLFVRHYDPERQRDVKEYPVLYTRQGWHEHGLCLVHGKQSTRTSNRPGMLLGEVGTDTLDDVDRLTNRELHVVSEDGDHCRVIVDIVATEHIVYLVVENEGSKWQR